MVKQKFLWEDVEIDFPSGEEENRAIQQIVNQAYPKQEKFPIYLWKLFCQLHYAIWNNGMIFMFFMTSVGYLLLLFMRQYMEAAMGNDSFVLMVSLAPVLFQTVFLLSLWNEKSQDMEELQLSCKYTLYHILLMRMLLICVMDVLLQWCVCMLFYLDSDWSAMLHMALFLTAMLLLYCILLLWLFSKKEIWNGQIVLGAAWVLLHFILWKMMPLIYMHFVLELPFFLEAGLILLFVFILFQMLQNCFRVSYQKYAVSLLP